MLFSVLKSYLMLLVSIGISSLIFFAVGLYFIFRKSPQTATCKAAKQEFQELSAIAGDDVITTQLDLARAYIETGKKQLAAKMLQSIAKHGNAEQQQEALRLMK